MDEAESYRHRQRVVAFAVLAAVTAAGLNGLGAAWKDRVRPNWGWGNSSVSYASYPYFETRWTGPRVPVRGEIVPPTWDARHDVNIQRAAAVAAVIAALGVAVGGVLAQMPHNRANGTWPGLPTWVLVWVVPGVLAQSVGAIVRELESKQGFVEPTFFAVFRAAAAGTVAGFVWWLVPCWYFRRATLADWWPSRTTYLRLGITLTVGGATCGVIAVDLASCEPIDLSRWVEGEWVRTGRERSEEQERIFADEHRRKLHERERVGGAVASKDADLRAVSIWQTAPVAVLLVAALLLLASAGAVSGPDRVRLPVRLVLWGFAGGTGYAFAVLDRGDLRPYFVPDGTGFGEHLAGMMFRGAGVGLAGGFVWVALTAAADRLLGDGKGT